jgi:hypothetical protein
MLSRNLRLAMVALIEIILRFQNSSTPQKRGVVFPPQKNEAANGMTR